MKKFVKDLRLVAIEHLPVDNFVLRLTDTDPLPEMRPGQFVEVLVKDSATTFLRRPISINYINRQKNELWLLIHAVGAGTRLLQTLVAGDFLNCIFPLGNGFSTPSASIQHPLLVGGGVGTAPLLLYGEALKTAGITPTFLLGGRSREHILQVPLFEEIGTTLLATEDGSAGAKGFVTQHPALNTERFDFIATCGPLPMMKAVANYAKQHNIYCEASLENLMACGIGACLCCVEKTTKGNLCVCTEGPVFNIKDLMW